MACFFESISYKSDLPFFYQMVLKVLFMGAVSYDAEYSFKPLQIRLKIDAGSVGFGPTTF
jgi:hypothetical protein